VKQGLLSFLRAGSDNKTNSHMYGGNSYGYGMTIIHYIRFQHAPKYIYIASPDMYCESRSPIKSHYSKERGK
jgi:hypothetical protein